MRLRSNILIAAGVAALAVAAPAAFAITSGSLDGGAHPAVGLLLADRGNGPEPDCSGSLVSPTVFVTAAHCTGDLASARVWVSFDPQYVSRSTGNKNCTGQSSSYRLDTPAARSVSLGVRGDSLGRGLT